MVSKVTAVIKNEMRGKSSENVLNYTFYRILRIETWIVTRLLVFRRKCMQWTVKKKNRNLTGAGEKKKF